MPSSFSRIDLPSQLALDHVFSSIEAHARTILEEQLTTDGLTSEQDRQVCEKVIHKWCMDLARQMTVGNLTCQGVKWGREKRAVEPLDLQLQTAVSNLASTVDQLAEDATSNRRALPQRWAEAVKAREEVLEARREKEDEEREKIRKRGWGDDRPTAPVLPIGNQEEVQKTMTKALALLDMLAEDLPAQVAATQEQRELVEQLRQMPP